MNQKPSLYEMEESEMRKMFGHLQDEYEIYRSCEGNRQGLSVIDGKPLKTFDQWLNA
jgi:hypothetical protein